NVSVIDATSGKLLSGGAEEDYAKGAGTFFDYKAHVEQYLAGKAEEMLAAVLGPNRARVRVNATIETTSTRLTRKTLGDKVVTREEVQTSASTPKGAKGSEGGSKLKKDTEENLVTSYEVPQTLEEKTVPPGEVTKLSIAALVDLSGQGGESEEGAEETPTEKITQSDAEEIIMSAVGFVQDRDNIKIVTASFPQPEAVVEESGPGMFSLDNILKILRQASLGILVIGALLVLKVFGGSKAPKGEEGVAALEGGTVGSERLLPAAGGVNPELIRSRITRALQDNPEQVKKLFLSWVEGEKGEV
ncbi:MAG: flagellar M-ring protein FliF C-terminal domain-containing protein, partial [Planctomycetota bacterium]